jgi:poly(hydroxyalkanoate) depolymerase family esterase
LSNPVRAFRKAAKLACEGRPLSAALVMQRMFMAPTGSGAKRRNKPASPAKPQGPRPAARRRAPIKKPEAQRPAAGTFVDGRFKSSTGELSYKLYTPDGSSRRRLPLVVMLHGCTQSAADFAAGTRMNKLADELGFLVLYPEQSGSANFARCWNWHRPGDQSRGSGEPATIAELTKHMIVLCKANPQRTYIAGISAGGAAAALIARAYPELYAAVGVHSGLVCGSVGSISQALSLMRNGSASEGGGRAMRHVPTIVFHGDRDTTVHPSNASGFVKQLRRSTRGPITSRSEHGMSGARDYTRTVHRSAKGDVLLEEWMVHGSAHAWSGGSHAGSHTDPKGPDASHEMIRFFLARARSMRKPSPSPAREGTAAARDATLLLAPDCGLLSDVGGSPSPG